jgi:hypothetical protein
LGLDVDHSPPSSAEVKNDWRCTSAPHVCLHDVDGDSFTLYFTLHLGISNLLINI